MKDAEYLFKQTERERKRTGRGDFCKVRQGGRTVRLPSDNLTAKQRKELNGKVMTYDISMPTVWAEFKNWPVNLKCEYIRRLEEKYNVSTREIAEMLCLHPHTLMMKRKEWGCAAGKGKKKVNAVGWADFLNRGSGKLPPIHAEPEPEPEKKADSAEPVSQSVKPVRDANNISVLLASLVGTGAKLTIEVVL